MQITPIKPQTAVVRDTIFGLQGLRFFAAAMVVVTHVLNRTVVLYPGAMPRQPFLESGVDIFFVISGFIMVYILKPNARPLEFWLQRFTRIAPLYWLFTVIAFLGGFVAPDWFFGTPSLSYAVQSLLFVPTGNNMWAHPVVNQGWTLVYEFAFYSILSLCLLLGRRPFLPVTVIIVLILTVGALAAKSFGPAGFYSDQAMMLEFLFGLAAAALVKEQTLDPYVGVAMALVGLVLIYLIWNSDFTYPRGLKIGLPAFLVVTGVLVSEPLWQRHKSLQRIARLGDASYGIYIVHFFLVQASARIFQTNDAIRNLMGPYVFTGLTIAVGLGVGILAHVYLEKPMLSLVRRGLTPRPAAAPAAAKV